MERVGETTSYSPVRKMENNPAEIVRRNISDIRTIRKNIHEEILDLEVRINRLESDIFNSDPQDSPSLVKSAIDQLEFLETNAIWLYNITKNAKDKIEEYRGKMTPRSALPLPQVSSQPSAYSINPDLIEIKFEQDFEGKIGTSIYMFVNGQWQNTDIESLKLVNPSTEVEYNGQPVGRLSETFDVILNRAWDIYTGAEILTSELMTQTELPLASVYDVNERKFEDKKMIDVNLYFYNAQYQSEEGKEMSLRIDANSPLGNLEKFALSKTGENYVVIDNSWSPIDPKSTIQEKYAEYLIGGEPLNIYMLKTE